MGPKPATAFWGIYLIWKSPLVQPNLVAICIFQLFFSIFLGIFWKFRVFLGKVLPLPTKKMCKYMYCEKHAGAAQEPPADELMQRSQHVSTIRNIGATPQQIWCHAWSMMLQRKRFGIKKMNNNSLQRYRANDFKASRVIITFLSKTFWVHFWRFICFSEFPPPTNIFNADLLWENSICRSCIVAHLCIKFILSGEASPPSIA